MRIAIMMRPIDQDSGFQAYVEGVIEEMLRMNHENTYVLLYRTKKWLGRFSSHANVKELLVWAPHKFLWDQVAVPFHAWREGADVIFNPKFSVPFLSHCPVTMGLQEPAWWTEPEYYEKWDVLQIKLLLPLYCRRATHIFPNSNFILEENRKYLRLPLENTTVTHPAPHEHLHPIEDREVLEEFRARYHLPARFIVSVTRVDHPGVDNSTSFYPGKNPHTTLRAFLLCRDRIQHHLVFAGRRVREYLLHVGFTEADFERVHFIGFVPFPEIAKLYNLADLIVVPSFYEGFGYTLLGAMACGCAAVGSTTGGCPEAAGDAVPLADPKDPEDFARKIVAILTDETLRQEIREKSLARAAGFSWAKTARRTLEALERVGLRG